MNMKSILRPLRPTVRRLMPGAAFAFEYALSARRVASPKGERNRLFAEFLWQCTGPCLQIGVKDDIGRKFGPNWTCVDKYDRGPNIDRHDDVEALQFPDATFEGAMCGSVLEHVPHPQTAIAELHRVLRSGGLIWVQVPFLYPYHESPFDYWRVTPSGLRIWMEEFEPIACACHYWTRTKLVAGTYFYGRKP